MSIFDRAAPAPLMVEIPPNSIRPSAYAARRLEDKRQQAIAILGERWCLASTRKAQIEQAQMEVLA